ncbi:class I SAM-dependent methyltransferase [Bacillus sp. RAR_GA_16]|uniref:class I SAM-dependent methyltransferase n=1 Tax=Bacillus sp. RAR_GA_16 TaxID=2876774 RepID=UPI001CCB33F1|nr:class I SAM-dependent methyltransferase [Bacillus sp. RAR_GA_16]MCA0172528.1 class I SAM-dependent methyltransferase [Bacillus sp. RAR_GA_16]
MNPIKQSKIFDTHAKIYEKRRKKTTIDTKWRHKLLAAASGDVLELSAGTGTNFSIYQNVTTLIAVDFSLEMVRYAREAAKETTFPCDVLLEDVEKIDFEENKFDTVVSTLSMCSYPHPEFVLEQMAKWCKPGGQVLLFEHGVSTKPIIANLQKKLDPLLSERIGCHVDRDMLGIVQHSSLHVTKIESHFFGMFHLISATV